MTARRRIRGGNIARGRKRKQEERIQKNKEGIRKKEEGGRGVRGAGSG